ncbi:hypothetical protein P154DRAFT_342735 [Amniculicola lignicola CBS 123094]|uniref:Xylanolytic transcriptional activator regulatory domain-containing protein n=1 Tax=Amniculicola lignicola CBS 123094 TaxID=1392246 RepID=A0A6A5W3Z0_9PLEO|nr:hypothetical protein P154DRAFT_342735 [Amniculicola lignicola CBS 123094]
MSSIKQVQDLQSQLAELRQENTQLRTKVSPDKTVMDLDRGPMTNFHLESQPTSHTASQRIAPPILNNFNHVRKNIRSYSREIFQVPYENRTEYSASTLPEIPPRANFAHLSRAYLDSIHEMYPVLHWPTFQREVDEVYTSRSFQDKAREWVGLFFAMLACGSLQTPGSATRSPNSRPAGMELYELSKQLVDPASQELNIVHAQGALLLSIFATESNLKSTGLAWAASAVRVAQILGLQCGNRSWPIIEGEVRRRLWWSIYAWDRITSLESNYPALINEDDCETPLPSPIEDRYIQAQGFTRPSSTQPPFTGLLAVIHVVRLFSSLYQTTKPSIMTSQVLQAWNEKFHSVLMLLPEPYDPGADVNLEPAALVPLLTLQLARFHLYRHNISPVCRPPERAEALRRCTTVAQDTAKYISRTLHAQSARPESDRSWHTMVTSIASHSMCLHLWRCMLMLCFRSDYDGALMCLHLASAIGSLRKINTACGKHLSSFLDHLLDRTRSGSGAHLLEHDEEMLAYVSADMQGDLEHSWVWNNTGAVDHMHTRGPTTPPGALPTHIRGSGEAMPSTHLPLRPGTGSSENGNEMREWDDWVRVEQMMRQLMEEHRARLAQPPSYYTTSHNPVKRVQLGPEAPNSPTRSTPVSSSASRISIAKLI